MQTGFDVVVVPDFEGPRARMFEARTLLFLGSWLENAGEARAFPLHLACIGEPPVSVRTMAARCQAAITVHESVRANQGRTANKLRGLEIAGRTPSVLLLDVDIVVLADPSQLGGLGRVIAVTPTKRLVPEPHWTRLFTACGVDRPAHRVVDAFGRLRQPYYSSGVVYLPRDCGLREAWEQDMRTIAGLFPAADGAVARQSQQDQFGLAVALERLRGRGTPVVLLPRGLNVLWDHLRQGLVTAPEVVLFHATQVFETRDSGRLALRHQLRYSRADSLRTSFRKMRWAWAAGERLGNRARSLWDVYRIGLRMQRIWDCQVDPVLRESS